MPETCCRPVLPNDFIEWREKFENFFVAAVLRVCVSKLSDWQVGPPRSLLAHALSLEVSKPILDSVINSNIKLTKTLDWQNSFETID